MPLRRSARRGRRRSSSYVDQAANSEIVDAEMAKGKFSFIFQGSQQIEVKLKHCIPLFTSRTLCESAIRSLCRKFDVDESGTTGFSYAGGLKVVVKIPGEELQLVKDYLLDNERTDCEAEDLAFRQGIEWYGVVDGIHTYLSLSDLERSKPDPFQDFKWTVAVIEWQPIGVLEAFSRARNMLRTVNTVEMTIYDTISGIHEIALRKANLAGEALDSYVKRRGVISEIADEYCGGTKYSRQTTRTLAGAALRIKKEALVVLRQVMTEEDEELAARVMEKTSIYTKDTFDARAYKNLISSNTVRSAKAFLDADASDQSNVLLRLKFAYEANGFKTFQAARLNKEIERCQRARQQDCIMRNLMGRSQWPDELSDVRRKLLQTSIFDSELDECEKNTNMVIGTLLAEYQERMPLEAGLRWQLYLGYLATLGQTVHRTERNQNDSTCSSGVTPSQPSEHDPGEDSPIIDNDPNLPVRPELCPLEHLDVKCFKNTLERYYMSRESHDEKFHLVLGDPSQLQLNGTWKIMIDQKQADKYVRILKLLVREYGWVFFYTTPEYFSLWNKAFKANGFLPIAYPWIMVRDTDTVQMNTSPIPQNITELLIGARKAGRGGPEHQPEITSAYKRYVSTRKRKFAILDNCPDPRMKIRKPNSREPLRSNQRSPEPIAEFLDTFCPPDGYVLDAFAGTMETAKACFMTGRKCVALEADDICFNVSIENLKESASAFLSQTEQLQAEILNTEPFPEPNQSTMRCTGLDNMITQNNDTRESQTGSAVTSADDDESVTSRREE